MGFLGFSQSGSSQIPQTFERIPHIPILGPDVLTVHPVPFSHQLPYFIIYIWEVMSPWSESLNRCVLPKYLEEYGFPAIPCRIDITVLLNALPWCVHHILQESLPVALIVTSDSDCLNWRGGDTHRLFSENQQVVTDATRNYSTSLVVLWVTGSNDVNEGLGVTGDPRGFHYQLTESILV